MAAGSVVIDFLANTGSFETDTKRAERALKNFSATGKTAGGTLELSAGLDAAANSAQYLPTPLNEVIQTVKDLSDASTSGRLGVVALGTAFASFVGVLAGGIAVAEKFERNALRTEGALQATGFAAGLTAEEIHDLSEQLENTTLADNVEEAAQKLLTFKNVAGDAFKQTLILAQDLSASGFGDLSSTVTLLGKALESPATGLQTLKRVGIEFSQNQKDLIANFLKTNQLAQAQGVVLDALRSKVGGRGEAEAGGLAGAYKKLTESVEDFFHAVGAPTAINAATGFINDLTRALNALNRAFAPTRAQEIEELLGRSSRIREERDNPRINPVDRERRGRGQATELAEIEKRLQALTLEGIETGKKRAAAREAAAEFQKQQAAEVVAESKKADAEAEAKEQAQESLRLQKEQAKAAADAARQRQETIKQLQQQRDLFGKSAEDVALYEVRLKLAGSSELAYAEDLIHANAALERRQKLIEEGQSITESLRTPEQQRDATVTQLTGLKDAGAIDETTFTRGFTAANDALADFNEQQQQARISARDALYEGLLTEEEQIAQSYQRRKDLIIASTEEATIGRDDLLARLDEKRLADTEKREQERNSAIFQSSAALFDGLAGLAKSFAGEQSTAYRLLFAISKSFAIADATLKLGQAIANAFATTTFPANLAAAAAVGAAIGNVITQISSVTFGGSAAQGGPVTGGRKYLIGERGPEMFVPNTSGAIIPNNLLGQFAPPVVNIRNINAFDTSLLDDYLGSDSGDRTVMNVIQRNAETVRQFVSR